MHRKRQLKQKIAFVEPSEASKKFLKAILENDYKIAREQLKFGADINIRFGECAISDEVFSRCGPSDTPLSYAVRNGDDNLAEFLLENKADTELYFKGKTPLQIAARDLNIALVELLLKFKANPNAINIPENIYPTQLTNLTPMHYVFLGIHEWLVSQEKETCLRIAELLVRHGFTGKYEQILGQLMKIPAQLEQHVTIEVFEEVWNKLGLYKPKPPLEIKKPNPELKQESISPLVENAAEGNIDAVKELLAAKANLEKTNKFGSTALSLAARYGKLDVVKLLLTHKANVEHVDLEKDTPLSEAITERRLNVVKTLIDANANLNGIYSNGDSALILAVHSASPDMVTLLLAEKAELNHVNDDGDKAISIAESQHYFHIALILKKAAAQQQFMMPEHSAQGVTLKSGRKF